MFCDEMASIIAIKEQHCAQEMKRWLTCQVELGMAEKRDNLRYSDNKMKTVLSEFCRKVDASGMGHGTLRPMRRNLPLWSVRLPSGG